MKWTLLFLLPLLFWSCQNSPETKGGSKSPFENKSFPEFGTVEAEELAELPLECITQEFPNKLGQVLGSEEDLARPKDLRPAFYGCFDWHSAVHSQWSLVKLLKDFPELKQADSIRSALSQRLTKENIQKEIEFFKTEHNQNFERTYGWAWLFTLAKELKTWDDPQAEEWLSNLMPLVDILEVKTQEFLPKLVYPIRVGEHPNTAFALSMTLDYAEVFEKPELKALIVKRSKEFYLKDKNCPIEWEPSGYDFLSPCLEEVSLMAKVLPENEFQIWAKDFMPGLFSKYFSLDVAEVSDRSDGKLVHLDGLNFSRAWNLYELADTYEAFYHLKTVGDQHFAKAYPNLFGDTYEGSHWLGTFALYALDQRPE
ncbi:DUF2891 domain-containing protein [Psychroflexus salinarum]|uniref:DUF2891 domain-containing protein n=1 Tax=Psychroflexus salinarum TaxID=546024 RepID=A0ABW3GLA1_9FLAO